METTSNEVTFWHKCELFVNTINHFLIGITTFYSVWYTMHYDFMGHLHPHLTVIGYQLLMAEGILTYYKANTLTLYNTKVQKNYTHWILQTLGTIAAITGVVHEIFYREKIGRGHFYSNHGIFGKSCRFQISRLFDYFILGLISTIFLVISFLSGCATQFSVDLRQYLKPPLSKLFHILMSLTAFITGMVSLHYLWFQNNWPKEYDPDIWRFYMAYAIIAIAILSSIGAVRTVLFISVNYFKTFDYFSSKEKLSKP